MFRGSRGVIAAYLKRREYKPRDTSESFIATGYDVNNVVDPPRYADRASQTPAAAAAYASAAATQTTACARR